MTEIASILKKSPWLTAIVDSAEAVLLGIDLSPLLMYFIDTASAEALPYLAAQFNVLGFKGWAIAETESEQRELLKRALELNKYKGTPWAIKEALKAVGFGEAELQEGGTGYSPTYNSEYTHDATVLYGGLALYEWATFNITFDLGESKGINPASNELAIKAVEAYKNSRSRLLGVSYGATISDGQIIDDDALEYVVQGPPAKDNIRGLVYDGQNIYNGLNIHEGTAGDSAELRVYNTGGTLIEVDTF